MQPATLGGLPGAGELRSRRRSEASREYRGVFAFKREHESTFLEWVSSREAIEYAGVIDEERRCLKVKLTDLSRTSGMAYFEGLGEPYGESSEARAG